MFVQNQSALRFSVAMGIGLSTAGPLASAGDSDLSGFALSLHEHITQTSSVAFDGEATASDPFQMPSGTASTGTEALPQLPITDAADSGPIGGDFRGSFFGSGPSFMNSRGFAQQGLDIGKRYEPAPGQISVAPLPPSAFGGLALMGGLFGWRAVHRWRR